MIATVPESFVSMSRDWVEMPGKRKSAVKTVEASVRDGAEEPVCKQHRRSVAKMAGSASTTVTAVPTASPNAQLFIQVNAAREKIMQHTEFTTCLAEAPSIAGGTEHGMTFLGNLLSVNPMALATPKVPISLQKVRSIQKQRFSGEHPEGRPVSLLIAYDTAEKLKTTFANAQVETTSCMETYFASCFGLADYLEGDCKAVYVWKEFARGTAFTMERARAKESTTDKKLPSFGATSSAVKKL